MRNVMRNRSMLAVVLIFAAVGIISFIAFSFLVHPQQDFVVAQSPPIYDTNKISTTILVSNSSSVTGSPNSTVTR